MDVYVVHHRSKMIWCFYEEQDAMAELDMRYRLGIGGNHITKFPKRPWFCKKVWSKGEQNKALHESVLRK